MSMSNLLQVAVDALNAVEVPFLIGGSVASSYYGQARFTNDVDIVIRIRPDDAAELADSFDHEHYYISREAAQMAARSAGMFNLIEPATGLKVDFIVAPTDVYTLAQFGLKRPAVLDGVSVFLAAPEHVIVSKLRAFAEGESEKHLRDIANIIRYIRGPLDQPEIDRWVRHFQLEDAWARVRPADA